MEYDRHISMHYLYSWKNRYRYRTCVECWNIVNTRWPMKLTPKRWVVRINLRKSYIHIHILSTRGDSSRAASYYLARKLAAQHLAAKLLSYCFWSILFSVISISFSLFLLFSICLLLLHEFNKFYINKYKYWSLRCDNQFLLVL